jgi:hypothetical protein
MAIGFKQGKYYIGDTVSFKNPHTGNTIEAQIYKITMTEDRRTGKLSYKYHMSGFYKTTVVDEEDIYRLVKGGFERQLY